MLHTVRGQALGLVWLAILLAPSAPSRADQPASPPAKDSIAPPSIDEALLFFPRKHPIGDWKPAGLKFQDVFFNAADGTRLHGWYCPAQKPQAVVLLAHGNGGNVAYRGNWLKVLQSKLKVSVFIFDYRGYGRSEGSPTVEGVLQDARAARTELTKLAKVKESEIVLMGDSLGGSIVVQLAAESPPAGLVLQSTFSSLRDIADLHFPKVSWLVPPTRLNSTTAIVKYQGPLLQSHGDQDQLIPLASAEKLFSAANEPKTFFQVKRAGHNNWRSDEYVQTLDTFLQDVSKLNSEQNRNAKRQ